MIEAAGLPALRIVSLFAVLVFGSIGVYIYRRRHQLFGPDPELSKFEDGDGPRHVRLELVVIVWGALMLVMLGTLYQICCA